MHTIIPQLLGLIAMLPAVVHAQSTPCTCPSGFQTLNVDDACYCCPGILTLGSEEMLQAGNLTGSYCCVQDTTSPFSFGDGDETVFNFGDGSTTTTDSATTTAASGDPASTSSGAPFSFGYGSDTTASTATVTGGSSSSTTAAAQRLRRQTTSYEDACSTRIPLTATDYSSLALAASTLTAASTTSATTTATGTAGTSRSSSAFAPVATHAAQALLGVGVGVCAVAALL